MFKKRKVADKSRLGDLLLERQFITHTQLNMALEYQKSHQLKLGESLIKLGFIDKKQIDKALSRQNALRSLCAGLFFIATPWCELMANEGHNAFQKKLSQWDSTSSNTGKATNSNNETYGGYLLGIQYHKSFQWGAELSASKESLHINGDELIRWVPQITFFGSKYMGSQSHWPATSFSHPDRFDRYKNTKPAIYRLTLKGYSLIETTENRSRYLGFNRDKGHAFKNYDLMFSITKHFD